MHYVTTGISVVVGELLDFACLERKCFCRRWSFDIAILIFFICPSGLHLSVVLYCIIIMMMPFHVVNGCIYAYICICIGREMYMLKNKRTLTERITTLSIF